MMTPITITGDDYGNKHLVNDDYYDENRQVQGRYYGEGAKLLGLEGPVKSEEFRALMPAESPLTGESLRILSGGDKQNSDGVYVGKRCAAIDGTMSAPKGFSVLTMRDERCVGAWNRAIESTIAQIESRMTIRDMAGGTLKVRSAMPVILRYDHTSIALTRPP
jgi:conjugative relaxase-like TrwC/TraI family protein